MGSELFSLEWDKFQINAGNTLKMLLGDTNYTDVTLACDDDKQIKAHKVILSSCSSFFQNILLKNPHPNPLIYLKGVSFAELNSIIKFMYLGQTEVKQEDLNHFMEIAQDLKVLGLLGELGKDVLPNVDEIENLGKLVEKVKENEKEDVELVKQEDEPQSRNFSQYDIFEESLDLAVEGVKTKEKDNESFHCEMCDFGTKSSSSLHRHQKLIHSASRTKYRCNICEKTFSLPHGLAQHKKTAHDDTKYSCNVCDFESIGEYRLKVHIKRMHAQ